MSIDYTPSDDPIVGTTITVDGKPAIVRDVKNGFYHLEFANGKPGWVRVDAHQRQQVGSASASVSRPSPVAVPVRQGRPDFHTRAVQLSEDLAAIREGRPCREDAAAVAARTATFAVADTPSAAHGKAPAKPAPSPLAVNGDAVLRHLKLIAKHG